MQEMCKLKGGPDMSLMGTWINYVSILDLKVYMLMTHTQNGVISSPSHTLLTHYVDFIWLLGRKRVNTTLFHET